uniref:Vesicle tethering protein Uso1/P115-like head domain-containing protein n=2 Tax=Tetranychus urticae TaxID=32264 RepID=T1JUH9_TETUR
MFAKKTKNISLVIELIEEYDFKIRWPALKLITNLLRNKPKDIQDGILASPMGVSRLVDLLADGRDIIRNDAILLLVHLTRGNANIKKIVAFENGFDRLLEIIATECYCDGGVIVEDCLIVLRNLLTNNNSNQFFFKEGSYIQRLIPFLDVTEWSGHRSNNFLFFLQVIRALVSPSNPQQVTSACQKVMHSSGILKRICDILSTLGIPSDILTEAINTVAEIIRGNDHNQQYFSSLEAPVEPPKSLLVLLVMSMVDEKQCFDLRCAILYCFECYLFQNEFIKDQVVQTLLPNAPETSSVTLGQLLCGGLFSNDPLSNWFVSTALSHTLIGNNILKEQLLKVQLATEGKTTSTSLMEQCCSLLHSYSKHQTRIGLLMFLSNWLSDCPVAVSHFLQIPSNIPFLTVQLGNMEDDDMDVLISGLSAFLLGICILNNNDSVQSYTREDLLESIMKRVGLDIFLDKLRSVSKSEKFSSASQKPQIKILKADQLIFDYEFCKLFRTLEASIVKSVQNNPEDSVNGPESKMSAEQNRLLMQLIREQDESISSLKDENTSLKNQLSELEELTATNQQLHDQIALLKHQLHQYATTNQQLHDQIRHLESQLHQYATTNQQLHDHIALQEAQLHQYAATNKQLHDQITNSDIP